MQMMGIFTSVDTLYNTIIQSNFNKADFIQFII